MKKTLLTLVLTLIGIHTTFAQIGIGTTSPDASAQLELQSTEKGFLPPRMDTDARDGIGSPAEGLTIYNTDNKCLEVFDNADWISICDGSVVTTIPTITGPSGREWMDRNLGASQQLNNYNFPNSESYGDLYQWGRTADGHQLRDSTPSNGPVASGDEGSDFITANSDWLSTPDDNRWNTNETSQGVVAKTANDPCPPGYRVPTMAEWEAESSDWDDAFDAFNSTLKLPRAGSRSRGDGSISNLGATGFYWSSTVNTTEARHLYFTSTSVFETFDDNRANGFSVRCIKE